MKFFRTVFFVILVLFLTANSGLCALTNISDNPQCPVYQYIPKNFDLFKEHRLVVLLHGRGHEAKDMIEYWASIADKEQFILLAPQAIGEKKEWGEHLYASERKVLRYVVEISKNYKLDLRKTTLAGFSLGGTYALKWGLKYPYHFSKVIVVVGFFDQYVEAALNKYAKIKRQTSRFYLISGKKDKSYASLAEGARKMRQKGIAVYLANYPALLHEYPEPFYPALKKALGWLELKIF